MEHYFAHFICSQHMMSFPCASIVTDDRSNAWPSRGTVFLVSANCSPLRCVWWRPGEGRVLGWGCCSSSLQRWWCWCYGCASVSGCAGGWKEGEQRTRALSVSAKVLALNLPFLGRWLGGSLDVMGIVCASLKNRVEHASSSRTSRTARTRYCIQACLFPGQQFRPYQNDFMFHGSGRTNVLQITKKNVN